MSLADRQFEDLAGQIRESRVRAAGVARSMAELRVSATAPRRSVTVTVGARGEVLALEFPTGAYKRMAPADLSEVIMSTIGQAQDKAAAAAMELAAPGAEAGDEAPRGPAASLRLMEVVRGTADPVAALGDMPPLLDMFREFMAHVRATGEESQ